MKILEVVDIKSWAIGGLAETIKNKNPHLDIKIIEIHPKDLRNKPEETTKYFEKEIIEFNPDIIHFHYWDVANTLSKNKFCNGRKIILTHHNQKNLLSHEWTKIDQLVVHTLKARRILENKGYWNVEVIQHGIDIEKYQFNSNYDTSNYLLGYIGRVVPWKGLKEVLRLAEEVGSEVIMLGRIDKGDYWQECLKYENVMDLRFGAKEELKTDVIHEMGVYIGNSCDNIEEGTLGLLEAMACGIPVITTPSGEAKDIIRDGENGILVEFENYESLKNGFNRFQSLNKEEKNKMRDNAWNTVKNMNQDVMARKYEKLYYNVLFGKDLVSVIIPTFERSDKLKEILNAYAKQTYKPIEIIVVDDNSQDEGKTKQVVNDFAKENYGNIAVKYLNTGKDGYNLAMARNMGIFEATGNYIVFSDDRVLPEPTVIYNFVSRIKQEKERCAVWGDKGNGKRDFIENFFIIRKKDIAEAGMFNERINEYGGQSQEIRERLRSLNYKLIFEPSACAIMNKSSHNKSKKRYEILHMKTKLWKLKN